jgi:hypothetical protein
MRLPLAAAVIPLCAVVAAAETRPGVAAAPEEGGPRNSEVMWIFDWQPPSVPPTAESLTVRPTHEDFQTIRRCPTDPAE